MRLRLIAVVSPRAAETVKVNHLLLLAPVGLDSEKYCHPRVNVLCEQGVFNASMFVNNLGYLSNSHDMDLPMDEYLFKGVSNVHLDAQNIIIAKYVNCVSAFSP